jgi:hypothetical protein
MFKNAIANKVVEIIDSTIDKYSKEYGEDAQLMLIEGDTLSIWGLCKFKKRESINVIDLNIPLISPEVVEKKILESMRVLKEENKLSRSRCMLLKNKDRDLVCFLYDGDTPVKQIDIKKLI